MEAATRREEASMAKKASPVGTRVADGMEAKRSGSPRYRQAHDRLQPFEQLARLVIMRRARLGLSQQDLG